MEFTECIESYISKAEDDAEIEKLIEKFNYLKDENHLIIYIPERIALIKKTLEMPEFNMSEFNNGIPEDIIKNNFKNGNVPTNKDIVKMADIMKPIVKQLYEDTGIIKIWLLLLVPKIEDGSRIGVTIQKTFIMSLLKTQINALRYFDDIGVSYYKNRAKMITKVLKYPLNEDNQIAIKEFDEDYRRKARGKLLYILGTYMTMIDFVIKNLERLKDPQPEIYEL